MFLSSSNQMLCRVECPAPWGCVLWSRSREHGFLLFFFVCPVQSCLEMFSVLKCNQSDESVFLKAWVLNEDSSGLSLLDPVAGDHLFPVTVFFFFSKGQIEYHTL